MSPEREQNLHRAFQVGVILKAVNAVLELLFGTLLLFTGAVSSFVVFLTAHELIEDPGDFLATHIATLVPYLATHTQLFAAFYLLSHGMVKIILVVGLLRRKAWAYPAALFFFSLFALYELYLLLGHYSLSLVLLTLFDILVVWLIYHEYRHLNTHSALKGQV